MIFEGLMSPSDKENMEKLCALVATDFSETPQINVLEIGTNDGRTARGFKEYFEGQGHSILYWGLDFQDEWELPFPGANVLVGDSAEIFEKIPDGHHIILIDGCHCQNHVMLDFLNYGSKAVKGGYVVFHDTWPKDQGVVRNDIPFHWQWHGPKESPYFHTCVRPALEKVGILTGLRKDWEIVFDLTPEWGGLTAFRKLF